MEDVDFDEEGAEEPDAEAWETEDDEGVEDGMEAQDDSEVTFSLHSGERWAMGSGSWDVPRDLRPPWLSPEHRGAAGPCQAVISRLFLGQPS